MKKLLAVFALILSVGKAWAVSDIIQPINITQSNTCSTLPVQAACVPGGAITLSTYTATGEYCFADNTCQTTAFSGSAGFILNQNTLQSGSTSYVSLSSSTVLQTGKITFIDGSAQTTAYLGGSSSILNQNTLQSGSTAYPQFLSVGSSATISGTIAVSTITILQGGTLTLLANNPLAVSGNPNNFLQASIQNTSNGNNASADFIATNDMGNDSVGYIDLGINSSGYNQSSYSMFPSSDSYLYASNRGLSVGTAQNSTDAPLKFFTGGTLSTNERMRITNTGNIGIGTTAPGTLLNVSSGTVTIDGTGAALTVKGNVVGTGTFTAGTNAVAITNATGNLTGSGANLTSLNGSNIGSGTVGTSYLPTGTSGILFSTNTLQSGTTSYIQYLYVGSSATVTGATNLTGALNLSGASGTTGATYVSGGSGVPTYSNYRIIQSSTCQAANADNFSATTFSTGTYVCGLTPKYSGDELWVTLTGSLENATVADTSILSIACTQSAVTTNLGNSNGLTEADGFGGASIFPVHIGGRYITTSTAAVTCKDWIKSLVGAGATIFNAQGELATMRIEEYGPTPPGP